LPAVFFNTGFSKKVHIAGGIAIYTWTIRTKLCDFNTIYTKSYSTRITSLHGHLSWQ